MFLRGFVGAVTIGSVAALAATLSSLRFLGVAAVVTDGMETGQAILGQLRWASYGISKSLLGERSKVCGADDNEGENVEKLAHRV
jgi:hypothetical protein